jgi:transcriptional regulator with XRE-family HTH domain
MPTTALGKFIVSEMRKRNFTEREFADFVGVASSTINGYVSEATSRHHEPSLRFLKRLSEATGISMKLALSLAYPELGKELEAGVDPRILALAERLGELPDSTVDLILRLAGTMKDEGAPD